MRYYFLIAMLSFLGNVIAQTPESIILNPNSSSGTMTDPRDNQTYQTITIEKEVGLGVVHIHTWMAENLNYDTIGSYCYNNKAANCTQYGRLYTWEAALNVCPTGWHLPTDLEWQRLIHQFSIGGLVGNDDQGDKAAYSALTVDGASGFSAQLGGSRTSNGEFIGLGRDGSFWSASEYGAGLAWFFYFLGGTQRLSRNDLGKSLGFSVRCVQDN